VTSESLLLQLVLVIVEFSLDFDTLFNFFPVDLLSWQAVQDDLQAFLFHGILLSRRQHAISSPLSLSRLHHHPALSLQALMGSPVVQGVLALLIVYQQATG